MARPKKESRLRRRNGRYYGEFRDLGGGREALIPPGESRATKDRDVAAYLASERVKELERRHRDRTLLNVEHEASLAEYGARHLELKAKSGGVTRRWLRQSEGHLRIAVSFFGADVDLRAITPRHVEGYVEFLRRRSNGRGGTLSEASVRKNLNTLSNLYRRAVSERYSAANPVAELYEKPTAPRTEAAYLTASEAALLLESARTYQPPTAIREQEHGGGISARAQPWIHPILATFLLTGGRRAEVFGLEVDDVSFRLGRIYFRSNEWRRLKTRRSDRSVPLWPQLEAILRDYMAERERAGGLGRLLFPSEGGAPKTGTRRRGERMITDLRKTLDRLGERAGFPPGHIRLHMLRHTYTAARIQTLDRGAPVAMYTVARELGHSSTSMIEERYGHLHDRAVLGGSEVVEYRVEHHQEELQARLRELRQ